MGELIKCVRPGWQYYTDNGKLAALLFIALLFLWLGKKEIRERYCSLILYAAIMTACCVCPLTAAVLMKYQTRFYDYQWIWNLVPMTIIISLAGTLFYTGLVDKYAKQKGRWWKSAGTAALLIAVIYLCGKMRNDVWDADEERRKLEETARVVEILTENGQNTDISLWAPQEIMEYARAIDGHIRLPYGRNMWDKALNTYSYDIYGEREETLYVWMEYVAETGEGIAVVEIEVENAAGEADEVGGNASEEAKKRVIEANECLDMAVQLGVNRILLPGNLEPEVLSEMEDYLGIQAEELDSYYLFRL